MYVFAATEEGGRYLLKQAFLFVLSIPFFPFSSPIAFSEKKKLDHLPTASVRSKVEWSLAIFVLCVDIDPLRGNQGL